MVRNSKPSGVGYSWSWTIFLGTADAVYFPPIDNIRIDSAVPYASVEIRSKPLLSDEVQRGSIQKASCEIKHADDTGSLPLN
jgi:hypothetical protein